MCDLLLLTMLTQCVHIRYPILVPNIILLLLVLQLKIPKTTKVIDISCKLLVVLEYPAFHISLSWWCFLSCEPNSLIVKFSLLEAYIIAQAKLLQPIMLWSCSILVIVPYKNNTKHWKNYDYIKHVLIWQFQFCLCESGLSTSPSARFSKTYDFKSLLVNPKKT